MVGIWLGERGRVKFKEKWVGFRVGKRGSIKGGKNGEG
jgi:hypothetical protein